MAHSGQARETLSRREHEIARAYADGMTYKEIAQKLYIAPATVRTHLATIYRKLGVSTKVALLRTLNAERAHIAAPEEGEPTEPLPGGVLPLADRRQVTVLSAVPDDLMALSRTLDSEEFATLIAGFRREAEEAVDRHGGTCLASAGAEVNACFGLPAAEETDAERAVNCALDIEKRLKRRAADEGSPLNARIGLFTGQVVAAAATPEVEGIVGGATCLASVLAREAIGSGIVVCARTHAIVGGLFTFTDFGPVAVDKDSESLQRFAVSRAVGAATRFEGLHGYRLSPLIGRDHEVGLLETLFHCAETGEGQIALISGEPGIGKSRLVRALADRLALPPDAMLVFQCSPHDRSSPLLAVTQTLRRIAGVEDYDTAAERLDAFATLFTDTFDEGTDAARRRVLIADLAAIQGATVSDEGELPAAARRAAALDLLSRLLERRAATAGVLLVVFEDIHWADPTTIEWFGLLAALIATTPILLLATVRPDFAFDQAGAHFTTLALSRLDHAHATALVVAQAGSRQLSSELVGRIARRSEGVPLFAEELVRAIVELGETENDVPTTLSALFTGRLDRLGPAREVAQAAAVIGRDFDTGLLAEILPHAPRAFGEAIDALLSSRLVFRRGGAGSAFLRFRHALIRDAAYGSLLRKRREEFHRRIAGILVARRDAGRDIAPELIAQHLVDAGDNAGSVSCWALAAQAAFRRGSYSETVHLCDHGLDAAQQIADPPARDRARLDLFLYKDNALMPLGDMPRMLENLNEAEKCARRLRDMDALFNILGSRNYVLASMGRTDQAIVICDEIMNMAQRINNVPSYVLRHIGVGRTYYAAGRYVESLNVLQPLKGIVKRDLQFGFSAGGMNFTINSYIFMTVVLCELGDFEAAADCIEIASDLARRIPGTTQEHLWAAVGMGRLRYLRGDYAGVVECQEEHLQACLENSPVYWQRLAMSIGPALVELGERERGLAILAQADEIGDSKKFLFGRALMLAEYGRGLLACDRVEQAAEVAGRAIETSLATGEQGNGGWARFVAGKVSATLGRMDEAARFLAQAERIARDRRMAALLSSCGGVNLGQMQ